MTNKYFNNMRALHMVNFKNNIFRVNAEMNEGSRYKIYQ